MDASNHLSGHADSIQLAIYPRKETLPGLEALLRAWNYAKDSGLNVWEFALEIDRLYDFTLSISDLRWLVAKGYADHGSEVSVNGDSHRSFEKGAGLKFEPKTCLVLTASGVTFVNAFLSDVSNTSMHTGEGERTVKKPKWHASKRELCLGDLLVKRFRVPARNQEWILEVFEEDGWPLHIDDPLPPSADICPKARLHDAINRLNGKQINPVLRFHGNGHGNGLYWENVVPASS